VTASDKLQESFFYFRSKIYLYIFFNRIFKMSKTMKWNYKCEKSFETRVEEAKQLKAIYKDSIPVKN